MSPTPPTTFITNSAAKDHWIRRFARLIARIPALGSLLDYRRSTPPRAR